MDGEGEKMNEELNVPHKKAVMIMTLVLLAVVIFLIVYIDGRVENRKKRAETSHECALFADVAAVTERPADVIAFGVFDSVHDADSDFAVFCASANKCHDQDPEYRSRAAHRNGDRDAYDV